MNKTALSWQVGYMRQKDGVPAEWMEARVPGAVQSDYARHQGWAPFYKGTNFEDYRWMEDVFWLYRSELDFALRDGECAALCFTAIDYQYSIRVDGEPLFEGEGMFTPIRLDVTRFSGRRVPVEVLLYPAPKADDSDSRSQARRSCKAAACYGWDWHPRLISTGIWDEAYLCVESVCHLEDVQVSYVLRETLDSCRIHMETAVTGGDSVTLCLTDADGRIAAHATVPVREGRAECDLEIASPRLWYPIGYGEQHCYTLTLCCIQYGMTMDTQRRTIGFRRSRLVMNEGAWAKPDSFPKSRSDAPATLEINGRRIFAKGSNWVNAQVFPGETTTEFYRQLLTLVRDGNMNLLRVWGGGYVNKEAFFDLCDEMGILVWQEFPLACNEYPDDEHYLSVLERESSAIVRRLRTHPCLVLWCGGNELFNSWSKMTEQHHALRLLDSVCYRLDRYTPFIMTSPLNGMAHGHYVSYDEEAGEETITTLIRSRNTTYTEFGRPGMASMEQLRTFLSDEDLADCNAERAVWIAHHAFDAWTPESWCRKPEVLYYFGGYDSTADLCEKTNFIQSMAYRAAFEEMRRQWPHCSMALNWCFNEPWPTAANNSLIAWPAKPKRAYYAVAEALRPQLASLRTEKQLWWAGEVFSAEIWMLNDSIHPMEPRTITVRYTLDGITNLWGTVNCPALEPQSNRQCGAVSFSLPDGYAGEIGISLEVSEQPDCNSGYAYLCRSTAVQTLQTPQLNR